jgi:glutathione peroxidase
MVPARLVGLNGRYLSRVTVFDFSARDITGTDRSLAEFRGNVLLIVNVASACGFTPQYAGLEALHRAHGPRGFTVLGFPCNQFGAQEPGTETDIATFCRTTYDVTFPMFAKVDVNGADAHPLFAHLKAEAPGFLGSEAIKWNFTKFLVDRAGVVRERFAPKETPASIEGAIIGLLDAA